MFPLEFQKQYKLYQKIIHQHNQKGNASPLYNHFNINRLVELAETAVVANSADSIYWPQVVQQLKSIVYYLQAKYYDTPSKLKEWGLPNKMDVKKEQCQEKNKLHATKLSKALNDYTQSNLLKKG